MTIGKLHETGRTQEHWKLASVRYFPAFESIDSFIYSLADVLFFDADPRLGAVEDKTIATLLFPEDKCFSGFFSDWIIWRRQMCFVSNDRRCHHKMTQSIQHV